MTSCQSSTNSPAIYKSSGEFEISEMQKTVTATVDKIMERAKNPSFVTGVPSGLNGLI